jgi:hypothetical protein
MKKLLVICLVLVFPFASADWQSLDNSRADSPYQLELLSSNDQEVKVKITVPGYHEKLVKCGDVECLMIHIPGCAKYMEKGYPLVPMLTQLVKIPHDCKLTLEVLSKEEVEVALKAPIVPSRGHFTRDIDPETVPFEFGPIYKQDVYWPSEADQFQIGKGFEWRDACGARLQVLPISANHVQMKMKVLKSAVVVVKVQHENLNSYSFEAPVQADETYNRLYSDMFVNYEAPVYALRGDVPNPNNRKLLVVTPQKFEKLLAEWVAWKEKSGYKVDIYSFAAGTDANTIKAELQGRYDSADSKFGYVVLIGDAGYTSDFTKAQPTPTFKGSKEGAAADRVYVRLAGNDNYPDAFISRISGNNDTEILNQFAKIMEYEKSPKSGEWFVQGTCIASNQGSPADKERAEWLQNGGGKGQKVPVDGSGLAGYGYTKFDDIYDPNAYAEDVSAAVNAGRSIICYIGHGSSTSWGTTGFNVSDIHDLTNNGFYPVIWSVACVNGQFVHVNECFGEAWLRKAKGGAVAIECASTNESWVPPCDKQNATVNAIINKRYFTFGALEAAGCIKALEVWGDTNSSEGNKLAEQCNLFGDCTMLVRTKKPQAVNVTVSRGLDNDVIFDIAGQERVCEFSIVTVYSEDLSYTKSSESENGRVSIQLADAPKCQLYYTVVGSDIIPVVDQPVE